ncbi:MAG: class I SAM-dependent methyltransferase [Actinobacteria bacterium]|nr:class I SAM-dependent methyltransferase [Actinomycetota bacterium]
MADRIAPELTRIAGGAFARLPLALELWDGSELPASAVPAAPAPPRLRVRDPRALATIARHPDQLGLGRAWVAGALELDGDAEAALRAGESLRDTRVSWSDRLRALRLARRVGVPLLRPLPRPAAEARLRGRRHSLRRDRVAARHHYDVPTSFYRLVLGPSLVYSCACFAAPDESLESAQERKLERVCRKLGLEQDQRLLDVGCGWGSLLLHAAQRHGVRGLGITLSRAQAQEARRRIAAAGLADRVEVRVADYRELDGERFDAVASIGMVEHVGVDLLTTYARQLATLVRPGGRILNHGIVRLTPAPRSDRTFIARYVFPDGELHPLSAVLTAFELARLEVRDVETLREHYPLTLRAWSRNLAREREAAVAQAGAQRERVWRLYMAGAALAFERGEIGVFQTLAVRPGAPHRLPLLRDAQPAAARAVVAA